MSVAQPSSRPADLNAIKERQHGAWSSGDYALIGSTLQIVGEQLCEALDVRAGQRVLDVAAGNGNVARSGTPLVRGDGDRLCSRLACTRASEG